MHVCPSTMCGYSIDYLCAYSTTKYITIRDARLGLLQCVLTFCIALYILVYQLIMQLGYLKFSIPQNSVRLTLQQPTAYCNPNYDGCRDTFADTDQLKYCCADSCVYNTTDHSQSCRCPYRPDFENYPCTWFSGNDAAWIREGSIMVTTFTHEYTEILNSSCFSHFPVAGNTCDKLWITTSRAKLFTADVEQFTLLIDHSVASPSTGLATTSRELYGMLFVDPQVAPNGKGRTIQDDFCKSRPDAVSAAIGGAPTDSAPCYVTPQSTFGLDYFTVGSLLQAMGMSLEEPSYPGSGHSARYEGLTSDLVIEYSNTRLWHGLQENITYVYRPSAMPHSTFKSSTAASTDHAGQRLKEDAHGILFQVRAGGQLAVFDFTQLLLQLTTSLTLLAMTTVVVNLLAQCVLQKRGYYNEAMYEETANFANMTFLESQTEDELQRLLLARNLPATGNRFRMILRLRDYGFQAPRSSAATPTSSRPGSFVQGSIPLQTAQGSTVHGP